MHLLRRDAPKQGFHHVGHPGVQTTILQDRGPKPFSLFFCFTLPAHLSPELLTPAFWCQKAMGPAMVTCKMGALFSALMETVKNPCAFSFRIDFYSQFSEGNLLSSLIFNYSFGVELTGHCLRWHPEYGWKTKRLGDEIVPACSYVEVWFFLTPQHLGGATLPSWLQAGGTAECWTADGNFSSWFLHSHSHDVKLPLLHFTLCRNAPLLLCSQPDMHTLKWTFVCIQSPHFCCGRNSCADSVKTWTAAELFRSLCFPM